MDGKTYGLSNDYIKAYVGENAYKQLDRWEYCERNKNRNFNIPAFIFSFFWCFKKRMYREFAVILALSIILPAVMGAAAGAGVMAAKGESVNFESVYSEIRRIPIYICERSWFEPPGCGIRHDPYHADVPIEFYTPWYEVMLDPIISFGDYVWFPSDIVPFVSAIVRLLTLIGINIFCGLYFDYMYFRSTRRKILRQLADMRSDEEQSRLQILGRSGRENREISSAAVMAFSFALMCAVVPVFYDAVCIMYNFSIVYN